MKSNVIIQDTLDTVEEMTKLIKKSPKRQGIFEKYHEQISVESPGIHMLATTRWTVRADAIEALLYTWTQGRHVVTVRCVHTLEVLLNKRNHIIFGLDWSWIVFNMADNLSKALQGTSISASDGQNLMNLMVRK